jgi:hypothetical protein
MAHQGKHPNKGSDHPATGTPLGRLAEQSQLDFELDFFGGILQRCPDYIDVLRVVGTLLTLKGRYGDGLQIDKRLVQLRPTDSLAHYNLACSYALLERADQALKTLRRPALPPALARVREPLTGVSGKGPKGPKGPKGLHHSPLTLSWTSFPRAKGPCSATRPRTRRGGSSPASRAAWWTS